MSEPEVAKTLETLGLSDAQAQTVAGGDMCSPDTIVGITSSLIQAYDNLVDFTSHVIERVAGS